MNNINKNIRNNARWPENLLKGEKKFALYEKLKLSKNVVLCKNYSVVNWTKNCFIN